MTSRAPSITLLPGYQAEEDYADGSEERLLDIFRQADRREAERRIEEILAGSPTWPERVHLSPQRHHLLDWYPFEPEARLLEVGAGCGALTGLLVERVAHVDALEPSPRRAEVLAHRHRSAENLRILVGDLERLAAEGGTYDVVAMIGVLEYAGRYAGPREADDQDPYLRLLAQARAVTREGGVLLLAIENQIGLKYLAGHAEDHHGRPLVGIEDYVAGGGVRTFARPELATMLESSGFRVERWYQPFPDYKLPLSIYSDELPLGSLEHVGVLYPTLDFAGGSENYFAESRFARILQRNGLLGLFANSHLAACRAR